MRLDPAGNQLLPRMYFKHGAYWYVYRGKWKRLDSTYNRALHEYANKTATGGAMVTLLQKTFDAYELRVKQGKMRQSTLDTYNTVKSNLLLAFSNLDPADVTASHIKQFRSHYYGTKLTASNRALVVLREAFEIGMDLGLCDSNPARQVKTVAQSKRTRRLTDAEFNRIRACAKGNLPLIMDVLYYTGQRIGDVLAIRQSDIADGVIHFVQQKTSTPLDIEIGPELDKAIRAARSGPVAGLWLFSKHGKPMSYFTVQSAYKAACERARVTGTTLHDIRAKAITDLSLIGGDAKALAGHTDQKMTDRYIRERVVPRVKSLDTSKTIDRKTQQ